MKSIQVSSRIQLHPNREGILRIWEQPEEGESYFVGADTAEGITRGDWSVAEVIRGSDCALVAEMRTRCDPHLWGPQCARIATHYNGAVLVFETHPSAHGLSAHEACAKYGYNNLYLRRVHDVISKTWTEKMGWRTDVVTKPKMIDRVRVALDEGHAIPSEVLLRELQGIQFKQMNKSQTERDTSSAGWKAVSRGHDDCHDAYAIALLVRDERYVEQREREKTEHKRPASLQEFVHRKMARRDDNMLTSADRKKVFDGN